MNVGINVVDIAHVRFGCPDLTVMQSFLEDFGLRQTAHDPSGERLFMRGSGRAPFVYVAERTDEPQFLGVGFRAETVDELETLASGSEFGPVSELDAPGGGFVVRATDPDGVAVEVVAGQTLCAAIELPSPGAVNRADERHRIGTSVRLEAAPANVVRLGHCVLDVVDYSATSAWYAEHLGFVVSDEVMLDDTRALGAFMRCNRGEDFVDHHTIFLVGAGASRFNHAAFEVANLDDLMVGHTWLTQRQHTHYWGVGRHELGSQVYDYWKDPHGHVLEHWTDGDLLNDSSTPQRATVGQLLASQWGPTHTAPH